MARATATSGLVRAIPLLRSFFSRAPIAGRAKVWLTDIFVFAGLALTSLHWPIRALAPQPTPAPAPSPRPALVGVTYVRLHVLEHVWS